MKEINSDTHSCTHSFASFDTFAVCGKEFFIILETFAICPIRQQNSPAKEGRDRRADEQAASDLVL
jgi:hypothetical protein